MSKIKLWKNTIFLKQIEKRRLGEKEKHRKIFKK